MTGIDTSFVGTFVPDSFKAGTGVATAIFEIANGEGRRIIKGTDFGVDEDGIGRNGVETLKDAVENSGEIVVCGELKGDQENSYLEISKVGPEEIDGTVRYVRYDAQDNRVWMTALIETPKEGGGKKGQVITGYGENVLNLEGMHDGDRLVVQARPAFQKVRNKGGEEEFEQVLRITAPGEFSPALAHAVSRQAEMAGHQVDHSPTF